MIIAKIWPDNPNLLYHDPMLNPLRYYDFNCEVHWMTKFIFSFMIAAYVKLPDFIFDL